MIVVPNIPNNIHTNNIFEYVPNPAISPTNIAVCHVPRARARRRKWRSTLPEGQGNPKSCRFRGPWVEIGPKAFRFGEQKGWKFIEKRLSEK